MTGVLLIVLALVVCFLWIAVDVRKDMDRGE